MYVYISFYACIIQIHQIFVKSYLSRQDILQYNIMAFCIIVAAVQESTGANSGGGGYTDFNPAQQTGPDHVSNNDTN